MKCWTETGLDNSGHSADVTNELRDSDMILSWLKSSTTQKSRQ